MPLSTIPIAAASLSAHDLIKGLASSLRGQAAVTAFAEELARYGNTGRMFLFNSGTNSFLIILSVLAQVSQKKEVVLPAYSSSVLVSAVLKAGLRPRLCDITLDDFGNDSRSLEEVVSVDTLCIVGVHLFGIISQGLREAKKRFPSVFLIEDCAQALGSRIHTRPLGTLGDISLFSFNRGKNLPTYGGGAIATDDPQLRGLLGKKFTETAHEDAIATVALACKVAILTYVTRPYLYGFVSPFIAGLKGQAVHPAFKVKQYTAFQAGVAASLLKRLDDDSQMRYRHGMLLRDALKDDDGLMVPRVPDHTCPAFNRFPIVFKDVKRREACRKHLMRLGIEAVPLYPLPLHHLVDLGYRKDEFPHATYCSEHLLTLPTHPLMNDRHLHLMIEALR